MKRPFFTTPKGQRVALLVTSVASVLMLFALAMQVELVESPRRDVPQLQSDNLQSCAVMACGKIEAIANLEPISVGFFEGENINTVRIEFVNHGRLEGVRDLRLELRDGQGGFLEAASARLVLQLNGRTQIEFGLTHPKDAIARGTLILRY